MERHLELAGRDARWLKWSASIAIPEGTVEPDEIVVAPGLHSRRRGQRFPLRRGSVGGVEFELYVGSTYT